MPGGIEFDTAGFMANMDALIASVNKATQEAVTKGAMLLEAEAKQAFGPAHKKGSPKTVTDKPQSVTGTLRRSIHVSGISSMGGGTWQAWVEPSEVYGRRIELGFHGADSLGRNYDQSGYPYMKPGLDKARDELPAIFEATWARAMLA